MALARSTIDAGGLVRRKGPWRRAAKTFSIVNAVERGMLV
jgi:hypothetical protein